MNRNKALHITYFQIILTMFIDLFLIIILIWGAFSGWRNGVVREGITLIGYILGMLLALGIYALSGDFLAVNGSESNMMLSIGAFIIVCILLPIAFGFIGTLITQITDISFLKKPNHILGAFFGVAKFLLLISFCFNYMENLNIMNQERTADSHFYRPVCSILPFLKEEIRPAFERLPELKTQTDTLYVDFSQKDLDAVQPSR